MLPATRRFDPITSFRREMDRLFDRAFGPFWSSDDTETEPAVAAYPVDIREDDKNVYVDAEVPGFKKDEIQVTFDQGMLRLCAEHREEKKPKGDRTHRIERRYRCIERTLTLPESVDISKAEAKLEDGVLHLTLPKSEQRKSTRIEIR